MILYLFYIRIVNSKVIERKIKMFDSFDTQIQVEELEREEQEWIANEEYIQNLKNASDYIE